MGKLIDADNLIIGIDCLQEYVYRRKDESYLTKEDVMRCIDEQPEVYNVEAVIEQMKEEKELSFADFTEYCLNSYANLHEECDDWFYQGMERAIEIVKTGWKRRTGESEKPWKESVMQHFTRVE